MHLKRNLLSAAVFAVTCASAQAATDGPYSDGHLDASATPTQTNWTQNLQVQQFNPALGVLTGCSINFSVNGNNQGSVWNPNPPGDGAQPITSTIQESLMGTFNTSGVPGAPASVDISFQQNEQFVDLQPSGPLGQDGAQDVRAINGINESDAEAWNCATPAQLAYFTGNGSVTFPTAGNGNVQVVEGSGNLATSIISRVGASVSITYTYDPALPECSATITENGGTVGVSLPPACDSYQYTNTLTCSGGDLGLTLSSVQAAGCTVTPADVTGATSYTVNCPDSTTNTSYQTILAGTEGSCSSAVTNFSCDGAVVPGTACSAAFDKEKPPIRPPSASVPTVSVTGLGILAGILSIFGVVASRRRRK